MKSILNYLRIALIVVIVLAYIGLIGYCGIFVETLGGFFAFVGICGGVAAAITTNEKKYRDADLRK